MASVNLTQRTFSKAVSITEGTPLSLSCVDTAGNLIKCNYVAVSFNPGSNTQPFLFVSPQVGSQVIHPSSIGANLSATTSTSGSVGFSLTGRTQATGGMTYEYMCLPTESFSIINMHLINSNNPTQPSFVCLTYGMAQEFNAPKAKDRYQYTLSSL